jgi:hypothetical protein
VPEDDGGDAVAELWREYKQHQTPEARERLILHYAPLVKYAIERACPPRRHRRRPGAMRRFSLS